MGKNFSYPKCLAATKPCSSSRSCPLVLAVTFPAFVFLAMGRHGPGTVLQTRGFS